MQAEDRGFAGVLLMTFPTAKAFERERNRTVHLLGELLDAAKAAGRLRADFVHQDVPLILMANAGVVTATHVAAPEAWRRLVAYLLQAFASPEPVASAFGAEASGVYVAGERASLPAPPTPQQMYRALTVPPRQ